MKNNKTILIFLTFILFTNLIFSFFIIDEKGKNFYYTNNENPTINISILNGEKYSLIKNISLDNYTITKNQNLTPFENISFDISFENFGTLNKSKSSFFKINILDIIGNPAQTSGSPKSFYIKYENETLKLLSPNMINLKTKNENFNLNFNRKIKKIKILNKNNLEVYNNNFIFSDISEILSPRLILQDSENHKFKIIAYDFYGNELQKNISISVQGSRTFEVNLITKKENSTLKYFFDDEINKKYPNFFNGKIHSSENTFIFQINTSKPATCYKKNSANFEPLLDLYFSQNDTFKSKNKLLHKINLTIIGDKFEFWIGCKSDFSEVGYVKQFGEKLIEFKKFEENGNFIYINYIPKILQTSKNQNFFLSTNHNSICKKNIYKNTNNNYDFFETTSEKQHIESNQQFTSEGFYNFDFKCFNKVYDLIDEKTNYEYNSSKGFRIIPNNKIYYIDKLPKTFEFQLSEKVKECRYISTLNKDYYDIVSQTIFFQNLSENLIDTESNQHKKLELKILEKGENQFSILCRKVTEDITKNSATLTTIYDPTRPTIDNLKFKQNNIIKTKLSPSKRISIIFNYTGLIPYDKINITHYRENSLIKNYIINSDNDTKTKNYKIFDNTKKLQSGDILKIKVKNILGTESNELSKQIQIQESLEIISSIEAEKLYLSCGETSQLKYGFSDNKLNCNANQNYDSTYPPIVPPKLYFCAVGKSSGDECPYIVKETPFNSTPQAEYDPTLQGENLFPDLIPTNTTPINNNSNDLEEIFDPEKDNSFGIISILIIIILIIGIISGILAYLYYQGKLDKYIDKYIPKYSRNKVYNQKKIVKSFENNKIPETKKIVKEKKIRKSYLDQIFNNKKEKVFDTFKKEEQQNNIKGGIEKDIYQQADTFEEYLKKKKKNEKK